MHAVGTATRPEMTFVFVRECPERLDTAHYLFMDLRSVPFRICIVSVRLRRTPKPNEMRFLHRPQLYTLPDFPIASNNRAFITALTNYIIKYLQRACLRWEALKIPPHVSNSKSNIVFNYTFGVCIFIKTNFPLLYEIHVNIIIIYVKWERYNIPV